MAKESMGLITSEGLLQLKRRNNHHCERCKKEFFFADLVITITTRTHSSNRSRRFHKTCWDKVVQ